MSGTRAPTEQIEKVVRLLIGGLSVAAIVKQTGLPQALVRAILRAIAMGLDPRDLTVVRRAATETFAAAPLRRVWRPGKPKPPARLPEPEIIRTETGSFLRYQMPSKNLILVENRDAQTVISWTARCSSQIFVRACRKLPGIDLEPTSGILALRGKPRVTGTNHKIFQTAERLPPDVLRTLCDFARFDTRLYGAAYQDMRLGAPASQKQRIVSFVSQGMPRPLPVPLVRATASPSLIDLVHLAYELAQMANRRTRRRRRR